MSAGYTTYKNQAANDLGFINTTNGNMSFLNDVAAGNFNVATGGSSTPQLTLTSGGNLLLGTVTDVSRRVHISGEVRITDTTTDPPTGVLGRDNDGDIGTFSLGSNLSILSGTLNSTWLKTELEAGRDVDVTGGSSTDFRLRSNTRVQFDGKFKIGSDSSFTYNPPSFSQTIVNNTTSSSVLIGGSGDFPGNFTIQDRNSSGTQILRAYIELDKRRSTFGYQWNLNETWQLPDASFKWTRHVQYDTVGVDKFNINYGSLFGDIPIIHRIAALGVSGSSTLISFFAHSTTGSVLTDWNVNGLGVVGSMYMNGTFQLNTYGFGNKEAADLSKTQSAYIAGFATDGTLLDYPISSLSNGIYSGSGTLSSHTTRALIPETGSLLFSQKYNSNTDSAYIQVVNDLDGNREVRIGLTDTASTGFATLTLKQDADNEVMSWNLRSSDNEGQTHLTGDGGNISATVDEGYEFQITGLVRAKQEAYYEITSTSSPQTLSSTYSDNLINQGGTQATFTLEMPASPDDGQVCYITFNNAISTLTIDGNGETIVGSAVVTGVAGSQRKFKFYSGIGWIKQY